MKKRLIAKTITGPALIWKRLLAFIIDLFIFNWIVVIFFRKTMSSLIIKKDSFFATYEYLQNSPEIVGTLTALLFVLGFLLLIYFTFQEYKFGDTVGKRILKIHVESNSKSLKWWQCLLRNLWCIPIFPLILLWVIDPIMIFFTQKNQRLSEIMSKTRTVGTYAMNY